MESLVISQVFHVMMVCSYKTLIQSMGLTLVMEESPILRLAVKLLLWDVVGNVFIIIT